MASTFKASDLQTILTTAPKPVPDPQSPALKLNTHTTDHMLSCSWEFSSGWSTPSIIPYAPLSLDPTSSVLHYSTTCFEGLKLYRGHDSRLRFFRLRQNCTRFLRSVRRIALPDFDPNELFSLLVELARLEGEKWLPASTHRGRYLYCRPLMFGDEPSIGVNRPKSARLIVFFAMLPDLSDPKALDLQKPSLSSGPDAPASQEEKKQDEEEVKGLKLLASSPDSIRAWPGGFGWAKVGANYGPTLLKQGEARDRGFNQVLWLMNQNPLGTARSSDPDGQPVDTSANAMITEAGASNLFLVWYPDEESKARGKPELITASLDSGVILAGVTRDSILSLARERLQEEINVAEKDYTIGQLAQAVTDGRVVEAFAAGTAWFVAPVGLIEWLGKGLRIPTVEGDSGKYAKLFKGWLTDIMYGNTEHEWAVVVDEK